ncbi:MAG: glycosyltransferase family 2 protein [Rivularia sp. (in: cyanobacteria)]
MNPKVSIIIPTYNTSSYITKAIESALEQTEKNIEVIVVDDASSDNTVEVVRKILDKRLKILVNQSNQGPSYSRNRALQVAKGEWVALLDSDDWYEPQRLEILLHTADVENANMIADNMHLIKDDAEYPHSTFFANEGISFNKPTKIDTVNLIDLSLSITKPLIKRDFLVRHSLEFNEALKYEEDFILFLFCLLKGAIFVVVPEAYYFYRTRTGSLMTKQREFYEQAYKTNRYLLQQDITKQNPELLHSLSSRFFTINQQRGYYRVKPFIKKRAFFGALIEAIKNPIFFWALLVKLPVIFKHHTPGNLAMLHPSFGNKNKAKK